MIDLPRNSPVVQNHHVKRLNINKNDEDDPPTISPSISPLRRSMINDDEEQMSAKRVMDKFKNDRSSQLLESKVFRSIFSLKLFAFKIGKIFMKQVFIHYNLMMIMMISNHQQNNHFTSIDNHPLKNLWVKLNFVFFKIHLMN